MISYAVREKLFLEDELHNYELARRFIEELEEPEEEKFRCHELARAVGKALGLPHVDGYYEHIQHTWLWTCPLPPPPFGYNQRMPNILDVYVPGGHPQVQLVDFHSILPSRRTYIWTVPMVPDKPPVNENLVDALADLFIRDVASMLQKVVRI